MADDLNMMRDSQAPAGSGRNLPQEDPLTRRVETNRRFGRSGMPSSRHRMHSYDRVEGKSRATYDGEVTTANTLKHADARRYMHEIHVAFSVQNGMEGEKYDFDHFMFLCYALNGGSAIMPSDRADFTTRGSTFEFKDVMAVLGVDFRRFFRSYANDVVDACRKLYHNCSSDDEDQMELRQQMIVVARKRGVARAPWLIADCLDAATNLTEDEGHVVDVAKTQNVGKGANSVDRRAEVIPVRSGDNYESSTGQTISLDNDVRGNVPQYHS